MPQPEFNQSFGHLYQVCQVSNCAKPKDAIKFTFLRQYIKIRLYLARHKFYLFSLYTYVIFLKVIFS